MAGGGAPGLGLSRKRNSYAETSRSGLLLIRPKIAQAHVAERMASHRSTEICEYSGFTRRQEYTDIQLMSETETLTPVDFPMSRIIAPSRMVV